MSVFDSGKNVRSKLLNQIHYITERSVKNKFRGCLELIKLETYQLLISYLLKTLATIKLCKCLMFVVYELYRNRTQDAIYVM